MIPFVPLAHSALPVALEVAALAGVRGNAESTLEQPEAATLGPLEPSATAAVLVAARGRWSSGVWLAGSGEVWTYVPEPDPTLLKLVPAAGGTFDVGRRGHVDLAARYSFEAVPLRSDRTNGRAEATARGGLALGPHRVDLLAAGVSRDWFGLPAWSFRTAEAGLAWQWQPSAFRLGARATGQYNAGWTVDAAGGLDAATGQQLRLGASTGWTGRGWDVGAEYRLYVADEGQVEDAARPQFTPVGDYDDDADALSAGGFVQHRLGLAAHAALGADYAVEASVLARIRANETSGAPAALNRSFHAGLDVQRALTASWSLHAVAGLSLLELPGGGSSADPTAWLLLRWSRPTGAKDSERARKESSPSSGSGGR